MTEVERLATLRRHLDIDLAGSLTASEGHPFEDYTEAVRNLKRLDGFPGDMVDRLARLPGFRNILVHDYVELDFDLVIQALHELEPVEDFVRRVAKRLEG